MYYLSKTLSIGGIPVITSISPSPPRTGRPAPQHRTAAGTPCSRFRLQHALRAAAFAETSRFIHRVAIILLVGGWTNPTHLKNMRNHQIGSFPQVVGVKIPKMFELVVSTPLRNISQIGSYPQVKVKIKNSWVATHLAWHLSKISLDFWAEKFKGHKKTRTGFMRRGSDSGQILFKKESIPNWF